MTPLPAGEGPGVRVFLNRRNGLESPVDIDALVLETIGAGGVEDDQSTDNKAGQGAQGSDSDATTNGGEGE